MGRKAAGHAECLAGFQSSRNSDASLHRKQLIFLGLWGEFWQINIFPINFWFYFISFFFFFLESSKKNLQLLKKILSLSRLDKALLTGK